MLILALDTTTRAGSCALWRDGVVLEERPGRTDLTHAQRLPGDLADLLAAHDLRPADVDRYAVASGPGSFTGLRVGIATIQALALVHDKLVVPVTALDALGQVGARLAAAAASDPRGAIVGAWMDAYRGEAFGALYRVTAEAPAPGAADGGTRRRLFLLEALAAARVAAPEALSAGWAERLDVLSGEVGFLDRTGGAGTGSASQPAVPFVIIGDGVPASEAVLRARWPEARLVPEVPLAATIAEMAAAAPPERAVHPHAIVPLYVRRSDAEILRERQLAPDLPASTPPASTPPDRTPASR